MVDFKKCTICDKVAVEFMIHWAYLFLTATAKIYQNILDIAVSTAGGNEQRRGTICRLNEQMGLRRKWK